LIPLIAAELAQKPDLLEYCSRHLKHIFYCGGHLPQAVGDVIAAKVPIHNQYGASEIGLSNQVFPRGMAATDWQYVQFHGDLGYEFEEITPGLFELIIRRHPIEAFYGHQVTFSMELQEQVQSVYRSRDLFEKHPTLPDTWAWRARADDIIVFLTGEKTNPISMELYIVAKNDEVANAMVVGMQRFQAALIIEPAASVGKLSPSEATEFIDKIWPSIEEANKVTPAHARVEKALVMLTDPDKPIIRSMKGTIQRYATITQYASEIDDLYSSLWNNEVSDLKPAYINTNHADEMSSFIARAIREIDRDFLHHYDDNDFFAWGMDSQVAMRLVRALAHGLGRKDLNISVVYNNPTLKQLASYLASGDGENSEAINSNTDLQAILDEYGQEVDGMSSDDYPAKPLHTVLLTGSTGSLGTYLLEAFLTRPDVAHVYCLNKRWNAENIHQTKAQANGFPLEKHRHRVSFITVRLDQPRLGLEEMTYNILLSMATLIVHNAWEVNFLKDISGFRSQLDGLTNLLRLASRYDSPPKVLFVSSVSSVARLAASSDTPVIPEKIIEDLSTAQDIGYAKSKLLGELICDRAARRHALPVSVARVGQIAGPVRENSADPWNVSEWLPSLIKTSMGFGAIPDDLGAELNRIDWVPADLLAEALVELTIKPPKKDEGVGAEIFNVVNPHAVTWKEVLPFILSGLERHASRKLSVVSAQSWLELLQKAADNFSAGNTTLIHSHPAIKLKDFYAKAMLNRGGVVGWETGGATTGSKVLKEMPPVGSQWVQKWIQGWVEKLAPQSSSSE
jgi:thioester reductase-like protein